LFHYATDGSVANLYIGFDTDAGDNKWIGAPILDQDDMSSNSATSLATQQSIVAYVTAQITAEDMDITSDSGTIDIDLNSETLDIAGGSGITTSASGTTVTVAGDNASTSAKGVASFSSTDFDVSSGAVSIKDNSITLAYLAGGTDGNIISYDASGDPVAIATGSDGQVLTSSGTGTQPAFETPSSAAISTYSNASNNRLITSVDSTSVNSEENLTYDGTLLTISDTTGSDSLLKLYSEDTGPGDAPRMDLVRNSASPADNDELGRIRWNGKTDTGGAPTYAGIEVEIADATNSTSAGRMNFEVRIANSVTTVGTIDSGGFNLASGYDYEIAGTNVLTATTLGGAVVNSSLQTLGTIGTGVWQGTAIASGYIAADAITGAKIADDAIDSEHYTDASIDVAHMSANSVDSAQYVNGSIDDEHLSDGVATGLAGAGTTASSGVLNVIGGNGITANANDIAVTAAQTTVTSMLNTGLTVGRDTTNIIDFATDNVIKLKTNDGTERLRADSAGVDITGNLTVSGNTTVVAILAGAAANTIEFEGTTADEFETTLTVVDPTADNVVSLPNNTGTVVTTGSSAVVTAAMMAADSVDSSELVNASIDTAHIANDQITNALMADDAIDSAQLASGSVDNAHLAGSIANAKLANSAVTVNVGALLDTTSASISLGGSSSLSVDLSELTDGTAAIVGTTDELVYLDGGYAAGAAGQKRKRFSEINLGQFNNDQNWDSGSGDGTVTSVAVTTAAGLDGAATITTSGTIALSLDLSELADGTADITSSDEVIYLDAGTQKRKAFSELILSQFNNDSNWTSNAGDIEGVTAGTGLTGGGSSGTVTLNVIGGTGITANANDMAIDSTVCTLTGTQTLTNKTISGGTY
jgi:hypothetical protein